MVERPRNEATSYGCSHCCKWLMARTCTPTSSGVVSTMAGVVSLVSCSLVSPTKLQVTWETLVSAEDDCCRKQLQFQDCHHTIAQYNVGRYIQLEIGYRERIVIII